jgi:ATP-dependent helicase HrpB
VLPLYEQFLRIAAEEGLDTAEKQFDKNSVQRCLLVAFPDHLARRIDGASLRCALVHGRRGTLARESAVKAKLFVAAEIREVESGGGKERNLNVILNLATAVNEEWLQELFPQGFSESRNVIYDGARRRVVARVEKRFRDLILDESGAAEPAADEAAALLAREVAAGRLSLEQWDDAVEQWILRVNRLREWMPELELPAIGEADRIVMIEHLCHGAVAYNEIRNRPVLPVVKSWLSRQQQSWIEQYAPERIQLPKGRMVKVLYSADRPPTIAARIQDLYGVADSLRIADRRIALRVEILAPSNRPVQVTENLAAFWHDTYPQLKQQLQRRYPKHEWR